MRFAIHTPHFVKLGFGCRLDNGAFLLLSRGRLGTTVVSLGRGQSCHVENRIAKIGACVERAPRESIPSHFQTH